MTLAIDIRELQAGILRASCPWLPGCVGYGSTPEEAWLEMAAAIAAFFSDMHCAAMFTFGNEPVCCWN